MDTMTDRATIIEAMETAFDVLGAPSPADVIHARKTLRAAIALAAVPPAPPAADRTPVDRLRAVLETQSSPTTDRGDSHGARGQKGWIVYESSLPFIAADLAADRAAIIEECRVIARKTIRTCEMQAAIMRDKIRTGAWDGAERVADAFESNGEKFAEIRDRLSTLAPVPPAPPSSDVDFTVDDTLLARSILTFLGRAGEASLEPDIDFHRDCIAAMICADRERRYLAPPSIPERDMVLEALNTLSAVLHGITWGDEFGSPLRARVIAAIAALEGK